MSRILLGFILLVLVACTTQNSSGTPAAASREDAVLLSQLEAVKGNLGGSRLPLRLVGVKLNGPLQSEAQAASARAQMVAGAAIVPQYDGTHPDSFSLRTVQERMQAFQADGVHNQDVVANIQTLVFPLVKAGQRTADLTWESEGKQFHSLCVYDQKGIVYDSVLSNLVQVQEGQPGTEQNLQPQGGSSGSDVSAQATYAFTARALTYTIKWIWGGTRGKITVDHTILWNGSNYIYSQNGSADYYMTLGSAGAKTRGTVLDHRRYAVLAYGYAWATPTASFSISFDAKKGPVGGSFNVSLSGVGSKGGRRQPPHHLHPLADRSQADIQHRYPGIPHPNHRLRL